MTDNRRLLDLARTTLTPDELEVWIVKHHLNLGRRAGSLTLGITEETFRHRLHTATRKLDQAQRQEPAA